MKNIVILISGRGSNMEAIVRACQAEGWSGRIAAVISNRPDAAGLKFAASARNVVVPDKARGWSSTTSRLRSELVILIPR